MVRTDYEHGTANSGITDLKTAEIDIVSGGEGMEGTGQSTNSNDTGTGQTSGSGSGTG